MRNSSGNPGENRCIHLIIGDFQVSNVEGAEVVWRALALQERRARAIGESKSESLARGGLESAPPGQYRSARQRRAADLARDSHLPLIVLAILSSFSSARNFCRANSSCAIFVVLLISCRVGFCRSSLPFCIAPVAQILLRSARHGSVLPASLVSFARK